MRKILIDTDVFIDFLANRMPHADYAEDIFIAAGSKRISAATTGVILSNAYYILRKNSSHQSIVDKFSRLLDYMIVINIDKQTIVKAINSKFKDFEDALQNYAGEQSGEIDVIVTRNIKDYKHSALSVMSPLEFVKTL